MSIEAGRAGQGKHTCSARHGMGPVTSGGSSKVQVGRVVRGQGSGTYADWEEQEQRPWWEGGGGRGRARYMAQSSMRGRSRQRANSRKGACERDCRAEGDGQLGREGQGTESCGMPDAAAASAGWSHGHTVHVPAWRAPLAAGNTEVYAMGWRASVSLRAPERAGKTAGDSEGGRERSQKPQRVTAPGRARERG